MRDPHDGDNWHKLPIVLVRPAPKMHAVTGHTQCRADAPLCIPNKVRSAYRYCCSDATQSCGDDGTAGLVAGGILTTTSGARFSKRCRGIPLPTIRCPPNAIFIPGRKDGLLVGVYEQDCRRSCRKHIPPNFTHGIMMAGRHGGVPLCARANVMEGASTAAVCKKRWNVFSNRHYLIIRRWLAAGNNAAETPLLTACRKLTHRVLSTNNH